MNSPLGPSENKAQLLISVTNIEEAKIALDNGADIIDLKEPSHGALGALPLDVIKSVVAYVKKYSNHNEKITSATIGDLPMQPELILAQVKKLVETDVDIIKIGFFESDNYQSCLDALVSIAQVGVKLIAVLFAENFYPKNLIEAIKNAGFYGVMLDTSTKNGLTLLDYYNENQRQEFARSVLGYHLKLGLAGSLKLQHVAVVKELNPTYIGFRGGVCSDNLRNLSLDVDKIICIRKTM